MHRIHLLAVLLVSLMVLPGGIIMDGANAAGLSGEDFSDDAGCIVFYDFEGAVGTSDGQRYGDQCTQGTNNTLVNNGTPSPGVTSSCGSGHGSAGSQCFGGDGTANYAEATDSANFDVNPITWGCRVYVNATNVTNIAMSHVDATSGFAVFGQDNAKWGLTLKENEDDEAAASATTWTSVIGRWAHNQNSGAIEIYKNGVLACSGCSVTTGSTDSSSGNDLDIGYMEQYSIAFSGLTDDCFVYSGYLTPTQICKIARFGFKGNDTDRAYGCS